MPGSKRSAGFVRFSSQLVMVQAMVHAEPLGNLALEEAELRAAAYALARHRSDPDRAGNGHRSVNRAGHSRAVTPLSPGTSWRRNAESDATATDNGPPSARSPRKQKTVTTTAGATG